MATQQQIDAWKQAYGDDRVHQITVKGHALVVKSPGRAEYKKFMRKASDEKTKADATEILFRDCCLEPEGDALNVLLEKFPAIGESAAGVLLDMAGLEKDADVKKL